MRQYERVPWNVFLREIYKRSQGEHQIVVAPTGWGKTTLFAAIEHAPNVSNMSHSAFIGTKTHDESYRRIMRLGYQRIEEWPPPLYVKKAMLWPHPGDTIRETLAIQRKIFREALDRIFAEKGWRVIIDEEHWLSANLRLDLEIATLHHQGRSSGLSLDDGIQRPAFVPVITYGSASHAFIGGVTEAQDLARLGGLRGVNKIELQRNVKQLERWEYVYVDTRGNGSVPVITKASI